MIFHSLKTWRAQGRGGLFISIQANREREAYMNSNLLIIALVFGSLIALILILGRLQRKRRESFSDSQVAQYVARITALRHTWEKSGTVTFTGGNNDALDLNLNVWGKNSVIGQLIASGTKLKLVSLSRSLKTEAAPATRDFDLKSVQVRYSIFTSSRGKTKLIVKQFFIYITEQGTQDRFQILIDKAHEFEFIAFITFLNILTDGAPAAALTDEAVRDLLKRSRK
jgi:hypothetical protein